MVARWIGYIENSNTTGLVVTYFLFHHIFYSSLSVFLPWWPEREANNLMLAVAPIGAEEEPPQKIQRKDMR